MALIVQHSRSRSRDLLPSCSSKSRLLTCLFRQTGPRYCDQLVSPHSATTNRPGLLTHPQNNSQSLCISALARCIRDQGGVIAGNVIPCFWLSQKCRQNINTLSRVINKHDILTLCTIDSASCFFTFLILCRTLAKLALTSRSYNYDTRQQEKRARYCCTRYASKSATSEQNCFR